jgi:hypothetical protein
LEDIKKHREWIVIQVAALRAKFYAPRLDPEIYKAYMVSWADALQIYTKQEITDAMAAHVRDSPNITPNEGMIRKYIIKHKPREKIKPPPEPEEERLSVEERRKISAEVMATFKRVAKKP